MSLLAILNVRWEQSAWEMEHAYRVCIARMLLELQLNKNILINNNIH